jgi:hypothetical protein
MLLEDMGTARKKSTANKDEHDFDQGLRCLAHLIAQAYLSKEKERLTGEKFKQEGNNENR